MTVDWSALRNRFKGTVRILSIDGGGIRGLIPAMVLVELEERLRSLGKTRPFAQCFDLLAGTSTGALIALGLAAPARTPDGGAYSRHPLVSSADLAAMYQNRGTEIFPRRIFAGLQRVRQAFAEKYDAGNFDTILLEQFGDRTIQDALTNVLVTSFDIERGRPLIIKKRPGRQAAEDPDFLMRDAARGSAAAPTFFEPVRVRPVNQDEHYTLIDGSMFASNPAMCAYVEARKIYPRAKRFVILSLGTGSSARRLSYEVIRSWGFLDWVHPSNGVPLNMIMGKGQSESVSYQLQHLPGVEYFRLDPDLNGCSENMDDADPRNIAALRAAAARLIQAQDDALDRLAAIL